MKAERELIMSNIITTSTENLYAWRKAELQYELNEGADGNYLRSLAISFMKARPANKTISKWVENIISKHIATAIDFTLLDAMNNGFLKDTKRIYTHVEFYALVLTVNTLWRMGFVDFDGTEDELMLKCHKVYFGEDC